MLSIKHPPFKLTALVLILILVFSFFHPLFARAEFDQSLTYEDVKESDWFSSAVTWGVHEKLLDENKTQFNPHQQITRADTAVILHRYLNQPDYTGLSVFTDVPEGTYYTLPVNAMAKQGVITGYLNADHLPNGKFGPLESLTRAQAALLIVRMSQDAFTTDPVALPFTDIDVDHYGYQALATLYTAKVIVGYADNTVHPNTPVTRAEFMEMLRKAFDPNVFKDSVLDADLNETAPLTGQPTDGMVEGG